MNVSVAVLRYTWEGSRGNPPGTLDAEFADLFTSPTYEWGIGKFWSDTTLGLLDVSTGSRVFPWRSLELSINQATGMAPTFGEVWESIQDNHDDDFDFDDFGAYVVFMDPPPSPSKGSVETRFTVLDWARTQAGMIHEVGHALTLPHSGNVFGLEYGDPYCCMSNESGTFMFAAPSGSQKPSISQQYFRSLGPMCSAAHVYDSLPVLREPSVIHAERGTPITLRAFSEASAGDPVLAVIEVDGATWTAEYRVPTKWDRSLPSAALVMHRLGELAGIPELNSTTRFCGVVRVPFVGGVRDWQATGRTDDIGLYVQRGDNETVTFEFLGVKHLGVELDSQREELSRTSGPRRRKRFPIYGGLCGEQRSLLEPRHWTSC